MALSGQTAPYSALRHRSWSKPARKKTDVEPRLGRQTVVSAAAVQRRLNRQHLKGTSHQLHRLLAKLPSREETVLPPHQP
jgi:hypothetical protein